MIEEQHTPSSIDPSLQFTGDTLSDEHLLVQVLCPGRKPSKRLIRSVQQMLQQQSGLPAMARELINTPTTLLRFGLTSEEVQRLVQARELITRLHRLVQMQSKPIRAANDAVDLFQPEMMHLDHEEIHVLTINTQLGVDGYHRVYKGTVNSANVRAAELFRPAILHNCPVTVIAHNHPSGDPRPSDEDRELTMQWVKAAELLDVHLLDHIIIASTGFTSLKDVLHW